MKETKKLKNKNGITLIALVITIIVMLILVALTITIAINGGLFNYAGKATGDTKNAVNAEQELANGRINVGNTWYDSIGDYLNNIPSTNQGAEPEKPGEPQGPEGPEEPDVPSEKGKLPDGITVGQYVNYVPTPDTYTISDEITGLAGYKGNDYTLTGEQTFTTQTGDQALKWRVWSIDKDNETVELVAATQTTATIRFRGADGYNHAVDILNDMCKKLYSNGDAVARSINIDDINSKTTYDPNSFTNYGQKPFKFTNKEYPAIYGTELGSTDSGLEDPNISLLKESEGVRNEDGSADYETYTGTYKGATLNPTFTHYYYKPEDCLETNLEENNAVKGLIITGTNYWLASRCVYGYSQSPYFDVRYASSGGDVDYTDLYAPSGWESDHHILSSAYAVRPIISLPSSVVWSLAETQIENTKTWNITL